MDRRAHRDPAPASASTALTVQDTATSTRTPNKGLNPNRRTSAFLAHLALQYDGVSARRAQRAQRLEAAITSYGAETPKRSAQRTRATHDLKI